MNYQGTRGKHLYIHRCKNMFDLWGVTKPLTFLSQPKLTLTARNTLFALKKNIGAAKNLKTGRVSYLGLEQTIYGISS
jgi:hypothetical protein